MFLQVSVIHFTEGGGIPACIAGIQAHTQGGSSGIWPGGVSRPTPRGKLRGLAWRGLQAHTQGEVEGSGLGVSPGPHPGGLQAHTWGSPGAHTRGSPGTHPGGIAACIEADLPPADGYCCG